MMCVHFTSQGITDILQIPFIINGHKPALLSIGEDRAGGFC